MLVYNTMIYVLMEYAFKGFFIRNKPLSSQCYRSTYIINKHADDTVTQQLSYNRLV